jgi:hypothetical protein
LTETELAAAFKGVPRLQNNKKPQSHNFRQGLLPFHQRAQQKTLGDDEAKAAEESNLLDKAETKLSPTRDGNLYSS